MLHDFEPAIEIALEPVDSVRITTLMDNVTDIFMPDQGPAHRVSLGVGPWKTAAVMDNGEVPVPITGEVPRTTGYEPGFPPQQAWLHNSWQPDPLVLDEQALIVNVRDKGLAVLTGCGHAGVVNIARYAQRLTGDQPLHALLGGFHLNGPLFEPLIPRVLDDLAALHPSVLVPAHCTGWRAQHAMSARFGPAFIPNSVGTTFHL